MIKLLLTFHLHLNGLFSFVVDICTYQSAYFLAILEHKTAQSSSSKQGQKDRRVCGGLVGVFSETMGIVA